MHKRLASFVIKKKTANERPMDFRLCSSNFGGFWMTLLGIVSHFQHVELSGC